VAAQSTETAEQLAKGRRSAGRVPTDVANTIQISYRRSNGIDLAKDLNSVKNS
jgi:hypothetical protein